MLKKIVVPLDGSLIAEQALDRVEQILAKNGQLILLSVIEIPNDYDYGLVDIPMTLVMAKQYSEQEYQNTQQRVEDYLIQAEKRFTAKGYLVEKIIETGDPATVINAIAEQKNADAIMMTTHGRTGLNRFLFGSVTQKVMSNMVCPVMVIPKKVVDKVKVSIQSGREIPATS
ncbi:MAG: universal stress protein [Chloroflexota bacterium]